MAGRNVSILNPVGERTTFAFDAAGRNVSILNPVGERTTLAYDPTTTPAG